MNITWTEHALIYYPMHGDIKLKKCKGYHTNRMLNRNSKDVYRRDMGDNKKWVSIAQEEYETCTNIVMAKL